MILQIGKALISPALFSAGMKTKTWKVKPHMMSGFTLRRAMRLSENVLSPKLFVMPEEIILGISTICLR